MATLKDHQQAMVGLMASGSGIPASAMRLAHATYDILETIILANLTEPEKAALIDNRRPDATTPGLNDKALAADVEACRPKDTMFDRARAAERRVKELENTVKQLRGANAKLRHEISALKTTLEFAETQTTEAQFMAEQAGCRKPDTQVCQHIWIPGEDVGRPKGYYVCSKCGATEL